MIQFAAPIGLLALIAIPVIIALHVLRPRRRTIAVASTALWRDALSDRQRGLGLQKLLRNLSLLLLLLAALAAGLALGQPQWVSPATDSSDTVIVLDTSASMHAGDRFQRGVAEVRETLASLPQRGRALLMTSARDATLRTGFETDASVIERALEGLGPADEAGSPTKAITLALSLLRERESGRVVFITDGAFDGGELPEAPQLDYRLVGAPTDNVGITRFDFRPEVGRPGRFQLLVTVQSFAAAPVRVPVTVTLERRTLLRDELSLAPGETRTLVRAYEGKALGRARARLERDDALAADNQAQAVVNVVDPVRVLLATPGSFFLERALAALPGFDVERVESLDGDLARLARIHDVVVADRVAIGRLPAGNFLLLDTLPPGLALETAGRMSNPGIVGQGESALMNDVDLTGVQIEEARRIRVAPEASIQTLFWSEEGPLAAALLDEQRRVLFIGFDPARSNLPLRTAFPVFMRRALEWLAGHAAAAHADRTPTWFRAGERVTLRGPATFEEVLLRAPDGEADVLPLDDGAVTIADTARAGIYRYSIGDVVRHFAVNLADAAESDLTPRLDITAPAATAPARSALTIATLWPQFTAAAIALLLAEWLLWSLGRRRA